MGVFSKDLATLKNTRLQQLWHKVTDYQFNVTWTPGKTHLIADALSCALVFTPPGDDKESEELAECFAITSLIRSVQLAGSRVGTIASS